MQKRGYLIIISIFANTNNLYLVHDMKESNLFLRIVKFYGEGFRQMTLGRTLWTIIIIKLFVIFVILKLFFFPNFISTNAEKGEESDFVSKELIDRANH